MDGSRLSCLSCAFGRNTVRHKPRRTWLSTSDGICTVDQSPFKHNRTAGLQQNKTDNHTAGLQQNKTDNHTAGLQQNKPATSGRSVDDLFVIAYQIYALALGLLIAYLVSTAV